MGFSEIVDLSVLKAPGCRTLRAYTRKGKNHIHESYVSQAIF